MFQFLRRPVARDVAAAWLTAGLMLQTATAAAPDWWAVRGVYKAGAAADDYAVANVGQLKHIASRAAAEMNATLAGGAGDMVSNLVASWHESASPRDDYSALTAGQLKQVARMFYDRLAGRGAAAVYPWGSPLPADDHAIVNTGQVKRVFSFPVDSNGNTLPDLWEMLMFGHLGEALNTDFDGDGLSNLQEWSFGTSAKNQDSDDDGYFDGDEHAMGADPKKADSVPQPNLVFYHRTAASAAWKTGFAPFTGSSSMSYTTKTTEMNLSKTVNDHGTTTSPPTSWTYLYDGSSSYTLTEAWERGVGTVLTEVDTSTGAFNNNGSYNFNAGNESDEEYTWTGPSGEAHSKWHREETIEPGDFDARSTGHWSIKQFGSDAETGSWDERTSPGSGGGGGAGPPFPSPVVTTAETVRTTTWELDAPYGFNGHASGGGTQVETLTGPIPDSAMVAALAGDFGLQEAWPATFDGSGDGTSQLTLLSGYSASGSATQYYYKLEWPEGTPERVKQTGNYPRSYLIQENYRSDDLSVQKKDYKHITLKPGESCEPMLLSAITFDSTRSGLAWVGPDDHHAVDVMQHPADVTNGSSEPATTQTVRLCRWLDAYDSSGNLATDYPRYDRDRIRIKIPAAPFPNENKITIKIATKKPAQTNDPEDAATDLECDKIGDSFLSKPIILVGDGFRAGNSGDDAWSLVSPQDEQTNDPTHIASPGGKVEIELPLAGNPKIEFPIAKYNNKVKLKSYVVRSPSSNARIPANILSYLSDGVQRTKDTYKQAHIKIEHQGPYDCVLTDAELDLINSDRGDGVRTLLMEGGNTNYLEDGESQFVFDKIRELDGGGTDFVRIIYMDCDFVGRNRDAVALTIRDIISGTNKFGVYEGFIVIPIKNASDILLPPHEAGHALKMLHPKDEAVLDGENRENTPELPYMLMSRASTSMWNPSLNKWMVNEYSAKRFVKKDLAKLSSSPTPLFVLPFP